MVTRHGEGWSYSRIARELNLLGVPATNGGEVAARRATPPHPRARLKPQALALQQHAAPCSGGGVTQPLVAVPHPQRPPRFPG